MKHLAVLLSLVVLSCGPVRASSGGVPFSMSFRDREGLPHTQIRSHARAAAYAAPVAIAVGVTEKSVKGRLLDGSGSWSASLASVAEPAVAGSVVVVSTKSELVALDARSGRELWRLDSEGEPLFGIDDDGKRTALTMGVAPTFVRVVDRDGRALTEIEATHLVGGPALRGPYVFVPWRDQFVSVFDVDTGSEVGRFVFPRQVSQAVSVGRDVYFGENALLLFSKDVAESGPSSGMWLTADTNGIPSDPKWFERGTRVQPLPLTATAFSRLFALPRGTALDGRGFATSYFRFAMGFDAETRALRWVRSFERPVMGGAAVSGGYVFCTGDGRIVEVSGPAGISRELGALGETFSACVVAPGEHQAAAEGMAEAYPEQLSKALLLRDPQMTSAQLFLLEQTRYLTDPILTQTLIDLLQTPNQSPPMVALAEELLAQRRSGAEAMLAALKRPYDYLAGVETVPPVGPLAAALAGLNEPEAAPLLATHLSDPSYDTASVRHMARALSVLAKDEQIPELLRFFTLNYATANDEALADAVNAVADALLRLGDRDAQVVIQAAAKSPMTHPVVRAHLVKQFDWDSAAKP